MNPFIEKRFVFWKNCLEPFFQIYTLFQGYAQSDVTCHGYLMSILFLILENLRALPFYTRFYITLSTFSMKNTDLPMWEFANREKKGFVTCLKVVPFLLFEPLTQVLMETLNCKSKKDEKVVITNPNSRSLDSNLDSNPQRVLPVFGPFRSIFFYDSFFDKE